MWCVCIYLSNFSSQIDASQLIGRVCASQSIRRLSAKPERERGNPSINYTLDKERRKKNTRETWMALLDGDVGIVRPTPGTTAPGIYAAADAVATNTATIVATVRAITLLMRIPNCRVDRTESKQLILMLKSSSLRFCRTRGDPGSRIFISYILGAAWSVKELHSS